MNNVNAIIEVLCKDATDILIGKSPRKKQKWVRSGDRVTLDEFSDHESLVAVSINDESFKQIPSYRSMLDYLLSNPPYSAATNKIGAWGRPEFLIQRILLESLSVNNGKPVMLSETAKSLMIRLEEFLTASEINYQARARVLGVKLTTTSVPILDNITLSKLTDEEMNKMQPYTDEYQPLHGRSNLLDHHTEIRFNLKITVDSTKKLPLLSTQNSAFAESDIVFKDIVSTLRLYKPGLVELGPRGVSTFFMNPGIAMNMYALPVILSEIEIGISDSEALQNSYRIIRDCRSNDSTLDRALHRFLLAIQRHDLSDRLVDFVIACESLFLTVNKTPIRDELSYRFSINGSMILFKSGAELNRHSGRKLMETAYLIRSLVVHGASTTAVNLKLRKAGFDSLEGLVTQIEEKLRHVIFWISSLDVKDRPYTKSGGWEQLLWGDG